ncbi:hypothetical protein [Rhizobium sp. AN80A]|nr:hypothetical protein [Rhizobium sp. AN80A]
MPVIRLAAISLPPPLDLAVIASGARTDARDRSRHRLWFFRHLPLSLWR